MTKQNLWRTIKSTLIPPPILPKSPRVLFPQTIANTTAELIASFGSLDDPHEGVAYLAGTPGAYWSIVTTVIVPDAEHTHGSYQTTALANAIVVKTINDLKLQIIAQVHGHPAEWVGHSFMDDRGAFMPFEGFYSIVLPEYGRMGMLPLEKCGVHRFQSSRFVQLSADEISYAFSVVPEKIDLRGKHATNHYA